uniref:Uncharacterized protein n=1 Tax=Rhizophora mucronata TaxID=61149 RepID=A0A2P2NS65_RHIMU
MLQTILHSPQIPFHLFQSAPTSTIFQLSQSLEYDLSTTCQSLAGF